MKMPRIPEATVTRLSLYSRFLENLERMGVEFVSSGEIAEGLSINPAQVRKDLAYFGDFGTRGVGYRVKDLLSCTLNILGLDQKWPLILVGAGALGYAVCGYQGFNKRGFSIVAVFDSNPAKIGKMVGSIEVLPMGKMTEIIKNRRVRIGIIAVPANAAQEAVDQMVENGLEGVLNYTPVNLVTPDAVKVINIDLSVGLESLTFKLSQKEL
ncbi:MAG TPA: redox-sensing transcriptional repressor Rex [Desulfotomaculum sp.]|nr:MAG: Redox-sensing transcriptional repressor rex [Desulfotomaculum sp. 46_296]HAG11233.1 redox-sensing transcriptional repressor Rex [Desulfotomaculum sp.]HBY04300.1 redox-sensing transcriptional repressor Rex [Desulfotomaculum sp.]